MMKYKEKIGSIEAPLRLKTPPQTSEFTMHVADKEDREILVCTVGKTILHYDISIIPDLHSMLMEHEDWMLLGNKDEKAEAKEGTIEFWGRSSENPIGGWYGLKKGLRGRVGMYIPPLMEHLGLAEVEHNKRNNRMRAKQ